MESSCVRLLPNLLHRFIRQGTLRIRDTDGKVHVFGNQLPGPDVAVHLHSRKLYTRLFLNPELDAAEAYMDGTLTLKSGAQIHDFQRREIDYKASATLNFSDPTRADDGKLLGAKDRQDLIGDLAAMADGEGATIIYDIKERRAITRRSWTTASSSE